MPHSIHSTLPLWSLPLCLQGNIALFLQHAARLKLVQSSPLSTFNQIMLSSDNFFNELERTLLDSRINAAMLVRICQPVCAPVEIYVWAPAGGRVFLHDSVSVPVGPCVFPMAAIWTDPGRVLGDKCVSRTVGYIRNISITELNLDYESHTTLPTPALLLSIMPWQQTKDSIRNILSLNPGMNPLKTISWPFPLHFLRRLQSSKIEWMGFEVEKERTSRREKIGYEPKWMA